jgi:DnaD/phage-associated family protein
MNKNIAIGGLPMSMYINNSPLDGFFIMPKAAAENMDSVSSTQIKVLVWLCANTGKPAEPSKIAESVGSDEGDVLSAVKFWTEKGILIQNSSCLTLCGGISDASPSAEKDKKPLYTLPQYSSEQVANAAENSEGLKALLSEAERILEKMLTPADVSTLFALYDWLKLPAEVIINLMQHCASEGKRSMRYIEKTAISWHEKGINTFDKSIAYLAELEKAASFGRDFMRIVGISGRVLTNTEKEYIERWCAEWGFSFDMVEHAYELTVLKTGKLSMPYLNSILRRWKEAGITTVEQAKNEKKPARPLKSAGGQSYDLDEFVRLSREKLDKESKE